MNSMLLFIYLTHVMVLQIVAPLHIAQAFSIIENTGKN